MMQTRPTEVQPIVPSAILPNADWADAFEIETRREFPDTKAVALCIVGTMPRWAKRLLWVRNALVAPFGLKPGDRRSVKEGAEYISCRFTNGSFDRCCPMPFEVVAGNGFFKPLRQFLKDLPQDYVGTLAEIQARHGDLVHWKIFGGAMNFAFISDATVNRELFVRNTDALVKSPSQVQTFLLDAGAMAQGVDPPQA